jgi:hypothetical protein
MILKMGTQVREAKRGPRIFLVQDLFWWLHNRAPKKPCGHWVLSDWKEMGSSNFAGSFLDSIQDLEILFSSIGQSV